MSWMLKHQHTPPAQGREQWERESVWPLIASSEYKRLCASEHTHILLQRKQSSHLCARTHTGTGCLISVIGMGGSERQAWIIMAGGHNLLAAPLPPSYFSSFIDPSLTNITTHTRTKLRTTTQTRSPPVFFVPVCDAAPCGRCFGCGRRRAFFAIVSA